jgi:SAM-dependent methyltransferase
LLEYKEIFDQNKNAWNKKTPFHLKSEMYNLEDFKNGKSSLNFIEIEELGDVKGKSMLHLQCHFGQDSLSWARMGANVTGVDFSDEAIYAANLLRDELKLDAKFICSNIYNLKSNLDEKFDIVFTSYGTIGWLPDLIKWGKLISHYLKQGGIFYIVEFHNMVWMFDNNFTKFKYSYFNQGVIEEEVEGTYADTDAPLKQSEYGWNHPLSDVINALVQNGLKIEFIHEFPFSVYNVFSNSVKGEDGWWRIKGMENIIPMMFSIRANKS